MTDTSERDREKTAPANREDLTGRADEFPRMVFRYSPNGPIIGAGFKSDGSTAPGVPVDSIIVGNPAALQNALDHGWRLDPQQAAQAYDEEQEERMRKREGKGESDRPRDKNFRDIDQHRGKADYSETVDNPRPGEPDNAPFQNTPYVDPQTGDLAEPPTSSPELVPGASTVDPVIDDLEEAEERSGGTPGLTAQEDKLERDDDGVLQGETEGDKQARAAAAGRTDSKISTDEKSREKAADKLADKNDSERKEAARESGAKTDAEQEKALRDKGAPPGARKG